MSENRPSTLIFLVPEKHSSDAGNPPMIDAGIRKRYHDYFENEFQEQFIFLEDYEGREAALWGGDAGWETEPNVFDGDVPELLLADNERQWLRICWDTAIARLAT